MNGWDIARLGWLLACVLLASVTDLRQRRIPNGLLSMIAFATPAWVDAGLLTWRAAALGAALLAVLFGVPAGLGKAGMGDAKLAAVLGLALGWQAAGPLLVGTAIALLIGFAVKRKAPRLLGPGDGFPLAPAFLVGLLAVRFASR